VINCPHCQAENESAAKICHACGKELATVPQTEALPSWLQALKPDNMKEPETTDTMVKGSTSVLSAEELPAETMQAPVIAPRPVAAASKASAGNGGTDTLVATQPTPASRPVPQGATARSRAAAPPAPAKPAASTNNDTASLINEGDLPAWLRVYSENDAAKQTAEAEDQSWMTGGTNENAEEQIAGNLGQSWQAPARTATAQRSSAMSVFGMTEESRGKVAKVTKPERVVAPAPVAEAKPTVLPMVTTPAPVTPARLGANRPQPAVSKRSGPPVQRMATIAFIVAFVIFLIVLGIFVIVPAMTK
jgi:hypothetical protein